MNTKTDKKVIDKLRRFGRKLCNYLSKEHGGLVYNNMVKLGFEYVEKPDSSSGGIYINKRLGLVVKENYITTDLDEHDRQFIVPTIFLDHISIQPLCNPFKSESYRIKIVQSFYRRTHCGDVHCGNVMLYNRKPVLVDW
jgi:hypothetical protein